MHPVRGAVQAYAWGMIGEQSLVAKLASNYSKIDPEQPYAEYWMGTHPKGESYLVENEGTSVKSFIGSDLSFLFKILSVRTALSIQAHPNKEHARILHKANPKEYPDDNHKPEMAIALTDFECLCAFRPYNEIDSFLQKYDQLQVLCGKEICGNFHEAVTKNRDRLEQQALLKEVYSNLMQSNQDLISQCVEGHLKEIKSSSDVNNELDKLFERLNQQYPGGDIGLFSIYFLNYFRLKAGEAILLKANLPHAYLYGQCVECMACSDNVVRAGLTPKFKDVPTLIDMLDYQPLTIDETKFRGVEISPNVTEFDPKLVSVIDDFVVQQIRGKQGRVSGVDRPSLMVVINGRGTFNNEKTVFQSAQVFLIEANFSFDFQSDEEFLAYRAF